jgi:hypothetical protein
MKTVLCAIALFWMTAQYAWAANDNAKKCRVVLEENFRACSEEDVAALTATIDRRAPSAAQFLQEAAAAFKDIDAYFRLDEFKVIGQRGDMLAARVVQTTLAKPEDRKNGAAEQIEYRHLSALLPEYETVVYTQLFRRAGGKWRLWEIEGDVERVGDAPRIDKQEELGMPGFGAANSVFGGGCKNGRCRVQ